MKEIKHRICRNKRPGRLIFRSNKNTFQIPPNPIGFVYSPLWKITHQDPSVLCTPPFEKSLFLVGAYNGMGVYFGKYDMPINAPGAISNHTAKWMIIILVIIFRRSSPLSHYKAIHNTPILHSPHSNERMLPNRGDPFTEISVHECLRVIIAHSEHVVFISWGTCATDAGTPVTSAPRPEKSPKTNICHWIAMGTKKSGRAKRTPKPVGGAIVHPWPSCCLPTTSGIARRDK